MRAKAYAFAYVPAAPLVTVVRARVFAHARAGFISNKYMYICIRVYVAQQMHVGYTTSTVYTFFSDDADDA